MRKAFPETISCELYNHKLRLHLHLLSIFIVFSQPCLFMEGCISFINSIFFMKRLKLRDGRDLGNTTNKW